VRKELFVPPMNLADIRADYWRGKLEREDLDVDPIGQFNAWMKEACDFGIIEPTAMSLATVGTDGRPLLRTVLLKGVDALLSARLLSPARPTGFRLPNPCVIS
jgi:pyridoxine/pyridoxamine 5'-phosphate oxidase